MTTGNLFSRLLALPILLFTGITSCQSVPVENSSSDTAIIFIPGYYGSNLVEVETGTRRFLTFSEAYFGSKPLALNGGELGIKDAMTLKEDGIFDKVPIVPGIYSLDIYGSAVKYLRSEFGSKSRVVLMPYDWRQDNLIAVRRLAELVRTLKNQGTRKIAIVAHSMGGQITSYYLRYGDQDYVGAQENWAGAKAVDAVVLAGVPYGGACAAFRNLQIGTKLGTAKTPLNVESLGSFSAMYQLMPSPGQKVLALGLDSKGSLEDADLLYDENLWLERKLGFLHETTDLSEATIQNRRAFVKQVLLRARLFKKLLLAAPSSGSNGTQNFTLTYFISHSTPTLARLGYSGTTLASAGAWNFKGASFEDDGDGSVTLTSAQMPSALRQHGKYQEIQLRSEHTQMLADSEFQKQASVFLHQAGF